MHKLDKLARRFEQKNISKTYVFEIKYGGDKKIQCSNYEDAEKIAQFMANLYGSAFLEGKKYNAIQENKERQV